MNNTAVWRRFVATRTQDAAIHDDNWWEGSDKAKLTIGACEPLVVVNIPNPKESILWLPRVAFLGSPPQDHRQNVHSGPPDADSLGLRL